MSHPRESNQNPAQASRELVPAASQMTDNAVAQPAAPGYYRVPHRTSIADLLDRVVHKGAVVNGDVIISLAGIDLIRVDLRLLLIGVDRALHPRQAHHPEPAPPPGSATDRGRARPADLNPGPARAADTALPEEGGR
ncbi:MAG: gas vesicle protein [Micromonosporaceae bacterium]